MVNDTNSPGSGSAEGFGGVSRRQVISAAAVVGVAGGAASLVGAQQAREIELEAYTGGWEGGAPAQIEGRTNPTLSLEPGADYTVRWTNEDGAPHNFAILDADETVILSSDIISEGSQTVEFTASEEMATYVCEVHPNSMRGEVQSAAGEDNPEPTDTPQGAEAPEEETKTPEEGVTETPEGDGEPGIDLPREYHAHLLGEPHGVETEASGEATFAVNEDGTEAQYEVMVENICNVTQAHIHLGGEGENGPVVVWLYPEEGMEPKLVDGRFSGTLAGGTITRDDFVGEWEGTNFEDDLPVFEEQGVYVNVHTEEYPGGEIRGQIIPPHE